jgi:GxxExxY protein
MPIRAPKLPRLTENEMRLIDYEVMAHAFAAHRDLGRLCDERIYQGDLAMRLAAAGIPILREVPITISFRDFITTRELDLVVAGKAIYELKAVTQISPAHVAQALNYLILTGGERCKLVNFRAKSVESQYVNNGLDHDARHAFDLETSRWRGPAMLADAARELVADWGTSLATSLYQDALHHVFGGDGPVVRQMPLRRGTNELGRQRFCLCSPNEAFGVTSLEPTSLPAYESHLRRLIQHSPVQAYHWINIARHQLRLTTIGKANPAVRQED